MKREDQLIVRSFLKDRIYMAEESVAEAKLALVTAQAQLSYVKSLLKDPGFKSPPPGKPGPAAEIKPRRSVGRSVGKAKTKTARKRKNTAAANGIQQDLVVALKAIATKDYRSSAELLTKMRSAKGGMERYSPDQKYLSARVADALKRLRDKKIDHLRVLQKGHSYRYMWVV